MRELNKYDVDRVRRALPKEVKAVLKCPIPRLQCFLAGGMLRSIIADEPISDIDVFATSALAAAEIANTIAARIGPKASTYHSDNAITVRGLEWPVQVIHRWTFATPRECIESFDFTIASAAFFWDPTSYDFNGNVDGMNKWKTLCDDTFYDDLAARRIVYRKPIRNEDAGGSMLRLLKFSRMGYSAPLQTVADVMARCISGIELAHLPKQEFVSQVLMGILREVDPLRAGEEDA